jgi:hypothetical protein
MDFNSPECVIPYASKAGAHTLEKHRQTCAMNYLCARKVLQVFILTEVFASVCFQPNADVVPNIKCANASFSFSNFDLSLSERKFLSVTATKIPLQLMFQLINTQIKLMTKSISK